MKRIRNVIWKLLIYSARMTLPIASDLISKDLRLKTIAQEVLKEITSESIKTATSVFYPKHERIWNPGIVAQFRSSNNPSEETNLTVFVNKQKSINVSSISALLETTNGTSPTHLMLLEKESEESEVKEILNCLRVLNDYEILSLLRENSDDGSFDMVGMSVPLASLRQLKLNGNEAIGMNSILVEARDQGLRTKSLEISSGAKKKSVLIVAPIKSGGTKVATDSLLSDLASQLDVYLLEASLDNMIFYKPDGEIVDQIILKKEITPENQDTSTYDTQILGFCTQFGIRTVYFSHLAWQSLTAPVHLSRFGFEVYLEIHDFYNICVNYQLLDELGNYCGGKCTQTIGDCTSSGIWKPNQIRGFKHGRVEKWQSSQLQVLASAKKIFVPDSSVIDIVRGVYPSIEIGRFVEVPHRLDRLPVDHTRSGKGSKIRILVLGEVTVSKGALIVDALMESENFETEFEVHFVGKPWAGLAEKGIHHGAYDRNNLPLIISEISPDVALFPFTWPETYSYTLRESLYSGVPSVTSSLGAPGRIVRDHGVGLTVEPRASIEQWLKAIKDVVANRESYRNKILEFCVEDIKKQEAGSSQRLNLLNPRAYPEITLASTAKVRWI